MILFELISFQIGLITAFIGVIPSTTIAGKSTTTTTTRRADDGNNNNRILFPVNIVQHTITTKLFEAAKAVSSSGKENDQSSSISTSTILEDGTTKEQIYPEATFTTTTTKKSIGLITFDLDDTLFAIDETVSDANTAQINYMNHILNMNITINQFIQTTKQIRNELSTSISYTELRKQAIRHYVTKYEDDNNNNCLIVNKLVNDIFDVWLNERNAAAERYIFDDTIQMLQTIRTTTHLNDSNNNYNNDVCIGAITNGRGNPLDMPSIAQFFDFCISGEDDDVFPYRKPHVQIYEKAYNKYLTLYPHHSTPKDGKNKNDNNNNNDLKIWVHVGDCLVNDVGASASAGAYAVWYNPIISTTTNNGNNDEQNQLPIWSTATQTEINQRQQRERQVAQLFLSSSSSEEDDDYNSDGQKQKQETMTKKKVATRITKLSELPQAIKWFL